jgi:general secretion pathway protein G
MVGVGIGNAGAAAQDVKRRYSPATSSCPFTPTARSERRAGLSTVTDAAKHHTANPVVVRKRPQQDGAVDSWWVNNRPDHPTAKGEIQAMKATLERIRQRKMEKDHEGGFTLIELLIVIVVLGILAAIVVFAVQNLTGSSSQSACNADYKTVETAAETYKGQMGVYPASLNALLTGTSSPSGAPVGPWLKELPSNTGHYTISEDLTAGPTYGNIQVATTGHAAADGPGNCAFAS